jgi:hypothetical protein
MDKPAIHHAIVREIYTALEKLSAPYKLLAAVGSWGDTLEDAEVLDLLKTWNETGDIKLDPPPRLS